MSRQVVSIQNCDTSPAQYNLISLISVFTVYFVLHKLYIYPLFLSPLKHVPGPPLGHPLWGQYQKVLKSEAGVPQREWVKKYGPVVRVMGPVGLDRLMFLKPEALHKMMVADWLDYPRVCAPAVEIRIRCANTS